MKEAQQQKHSLSAIELETRVSVKRAAEIRGISEDTFRRQYRHLIEQLSARRQGVKLKHVIAENAN